MIDFTMPLLFEKVVVDAHTPTGVMKIAPVGRFTGGSPHASYGKTQESDGDDDGRETEEEIGT